MNVKSATAIAVAVGILGATSALARDEASMMVLQQDQTVDEAAKMLSMPDRHPELARKLAEEERQAYAQERAGEARDRGRDARRRSGEAQRDRLRDIQRREDSNGGLLPILF